MPVPEEQMKRDLVEVCHRLYVRGFVTATDGNVSMRLANGNFLTSRSAINKGDVKPEDILEVNGKGEIFRPATSNLKPETFMFKPSTELGMHLFIYSQRPDVNAIVHAHPTYATAFAVARQPLNECIFPEVIVGLGSIPLAEYATPSTPEVAESLTPHIKQASAILLANHGVVTYGKDLYDAYYKMEKVEHAAQILFLAKMLGGEKLLSSDQIEKLRAISQEMYGKQVSPENICIAADSKSRSTQPSNSDDDVLSAIRQMIQQQ